MQTSNTKTWNPWREDHCVQSHEFKETEDAETVEAWVVRGPGLSLGRMIEGYDPVAQALLGTLFTWGVTAAGSAVVFVFDANVCPATSRCATVVTVCVCVC